MKKLALVVDSTAVIEKDIFEKYQNLYKVPLMILHQGKSYIDGEDITSDELFTKFDLAKDLPTTSQPAVGEVLDLFENLLKDYEKVIYITISSKISGTYQTGVLAKNQVDVSRITVFDTEITSVVQREMALRVLRMNEEGRDFDYILSSLEEMKKNSTIYLCVDNLRHLGRTGRVSNVSAVVGSMLKIKPILMFQNGSINLHSKIRTLPKAHLELVKLLKDCDLPDSSRIMIAHAKGLPYAEKLKSEINLLYPKQEVYIGELSPVISVHTGPNTVGIAWIR